MTTPDLESRLKQAAGVAAPPRSVVDEVMRRLPSAPPKPAHRWRLPLYGAVAALTGIAAVLAFVFMLAAPARFTLADVQAAVESQHWVHARFDAGQTKEEWFNLQTGEFFVVHFTGHVIYINDQTNTRLWYWKDSGVISQDTPTIYAPGQSPPPWKPGSAWDQFVGSYERAATRPGSPTPTVEIHDDTLNGVPAFRFDDYSIDGLGKRFLYTQVWADRKTRLPMRIKTRLQLGQREEDHKDWATGDYDFPATGPADIYALGVPAGTPIHKEITTTPADVQPILDGINHAHDNFLKSYRAIVLTISDGFPGPENLSIIWRNAGNFRQDYYLPAIELQAQRTPPFPPEFLPDQLLAWSATHQPLVIALVAEDKTYSWTHYTADKKPEVQVSFHRPGSRTYFSKDYWPEIIQWPTTDYGPDFQRLPANPDFPTCLGIRCENGGNYREDFYVDPKNDYLCMFRIEWTKRDGQWTKERNFTLSDLHRIADHVVAGTQEYQDYPNPERQTAGQIKKTTINLVPFNPSDIPPATFDPKPLLTGSTVVGF